MLGPRVVAYGQKVLLQIEDVAGDKPREECGVVAVWTPGQPVAARHAYFSLFALQHRGQEAAGIAVQRDGHIDVHKDSGLVSHVFDEPSLAGLSAEWAIGHVRYSTTGASEARNAQPVVQAFAGREVAVSHNGNITNAAALRAGLQAEGACFDTDSDSEVIAALVARHGLSASEGIAEALRQLRGGFSVCVMTRDELLCFRDQHGIRPLVIGLLDGGGYVIASETCALDTVGARYLRDVAPGEIVSIGQHGMNSVQAHMPEPRGCAFEAVYFSSPASRLGSELVYDLRVRLGLELASEHPADADAVIGVPDSATAIALGYARRSGLPFQDGLVKNRYVARTFIEPTPEEREHALRRKFLVLASAIAGKRLVVVDDSIVRGSTSARVVRLLREAGATEVHLRIGSPRVVHPCHYGVDMGHAGDYIADGRTDEEIARLIGADSAHFLSVEGLERALRRPRSRRCFACFTGDYPVLPDDRTGRDQLGG